MEGLGFRACERAATQRTTTSMPRCKVCVHVCELARAISRRALIAHGVNRHPFEIRIGGVSG